MVAVRDAAAGGVAEGFLCRGTLVAGEHVEDAALGIGTVGTWLLPARPAAWARRKSLNSFSNCALMALISRDWSSVRRRPCLSPRAF